MKYLVLAGLWVLWCSIHSGMICITVSKHLKRWLGNYFSIYRLFFNLVAFATIIPVIRFGQTMQGPVVFQWEGTMKFMQVGLLVLGVLLFLVGARHYDMLQFLGVRQIMTGAAHTALTQTGQFDTTGILGIIRHPWYLGAIFLIWAGEFNLSKLVGNSILTIYLILGTMLEERKLVLEFGENYRRYQKEVSMLIPFKYIAAKVDLLRNH